MSDSTDNLNLQLGGVGSPPGESAPQQETVAGKAETAVAGGRQSEAGGETPGKMDPAVLKADVARFVKVTYGEVPERAAQVMKTLYGHDYQQIGLSELENRLQLITAILAILNQSDKGRDLIENVIERIQIGMDQLPRYVLDDLIIDGDKIEIWQEDAAKVIGRFDPNLLTAIDTSKDRWACRRQMRTALRADGQFTEADYRQLSDAFNISLRKTKEIADLLKGCFDDRGNFQKALFEKNADGFTNHPQRIFDILWEFLRQTPRRSDRLPFLNSLQLLGNKIKRPREAVKTLVSDFILDRGDVGFPDRNALILAIQFLRTYNKEHHLDVEFTPEEVMMVNRGLDPVITRYAAWKIDGEQKRFVAKMITIRKMLIQSFEHQGSDLKVLPIRFLLALEREVHIFLTLVGGKTATAVIQSALNVYGNPASQIYAFKESPNHIEGLLQHLGILIRGIGRVGRDSDFTLLDDIKKRYQGFTGLSEGPRHIALVRRILNGIDSARQAISTRMKNGK